MALKLITLNLLLAFILKDGNACLFFPKRKASFYVWGCASKSVNFNDNPISMIS